ncbi:MAG TPA: extracellular solute-binding protein [Paenibacillus sp.]|nr:extracellular solute-binding protein [Paenibacillus sp.]
MRKKLVKTGMAAALCLGAMLAGCSGSKTAGTEAPAFDPNTPTTLKVAFFNDQAFNQTYGNLFRAKYPNIDFEIISTMNIYGQNKDPVEEFAKLIAEQQPDVVVMTPEQYEVLAAEGSLADLEPLMGSTGFELDGIVEGVVEQLRSLGGGQLYGLAPTFNMKALFYNKSLFDEYGVPYPTDGMTWEEVLALAARFPADGPTESRIYGLGQSMFTWNAYDLIKQIAASKELSYLNADATALTMDNEEWKGVFRQAVEAYTGGNVFLPAPPPSSSGGSGDGAVRTFTIGGDSDMFNSGRAAMLIDGPMGLNPMTMMGGGGNAPAFERGIVTMPVDANYPETSNAFSLSQIFGVNASSGQSAAAWAFVEYVNSGEFAKLQSATSVELTSLKEYATDKNGMSLEPFYKLKPGQVRESSLLPKGFQGAFSAIAEEETRAAVEGTKSIDEAFASLVARATEALATANATGEKERGGAAGFGGGVGAVFIQ